MGDHHEPADVPLLPEVRAVEFPTPVLAEMAEEFTLTGGPLRRDAAQCRLSLFLGGGDE